MFRAITIQRRSSGPALTIPDLDWVNPLIAGTAGVLGAAVGAGAAIFLAREDRAAQARADLARAFSGYLAATETLVFEYRRRPWQPSTTTTRIWALNRGGALSRYLFGKLYWLDRIFLRLMEGDRADSVLDQHRQAEANLRIVAPPRILDLLKEVDAMFGRWRREPPNREDWLRLRQKLLDAYKDESPSAATLPRP